MKKATILLMAMMAFGFTSTAQKVKEKDVIGTWKLVINVEEELEKEADDADTMMEEIIIKTVSGFVEGILDEIDIYFEFQKDNDVIITVNAYDNKEVEKGTWFINKRGYLEIEDIDEDNVNISADDDEWKLVDGLLVTDEHEDDRNVYMTRVN